MTKCFPTKLLLFCRLFIGLLVLSVCGRLYRRWSIETYFWRSVHGWRLRRGILFPYIGGNMTTELDLLHLRLRHRRFCSISMWFVFSPFFVSFDKTCVAVVCILVMHLGYAEAGYNRLKLLSNKAPFIGKICSLSSSFSPLGYELKVHRGNLLVRFTDRFHLSVLRWKRRGHEC
jgi:hypothetical protein